MMTIRTIAHIDQYFLTPEEIIQHAASKVGGKAFQLARRMVDGNNVPAFVVIPHICLQGISMGKATLNQQLIDKIINHFPAESIFAVRSSANMEDGQERSFAGLFTSRLGVVASQLAVAIQDVYRSAGDSSVLEYCNLNGLDSNQIELSVIVQQLIPADQSGVAFGANPVTGDRQTISISAISGLGEALVSGEFAGDDYSIGRCNESKIVVQSHRDIWDAKSGNLVRERLDPMRYKAALSSNQRHQVTKLLRKIEKAEGKYLDIEFAFCGEELFLLQARPITTIATIPDTNEKRQIWDNSNIVESYPEYTLPLTFSFISKVYGSVYMELARVMGMPKKTIETNRRTFQQMLGLIKGRVYYNLLNWYGLLALLPGYAINAPYMEKMMGVKEKIQTPKASMSKWRAWPRMIWALLNILWNLFTLRKKSNRFHQFINDHIQSEQAKDLGKCSPNQILDRYQQTEQLLTKRWQAPLLNDFFTMIFFGLLEKMCKKYFPQEPQLHNNLLAGSKDIISTQPYWELLKICTAINEDVNLKKLFSNHSSDEILTQLPGTGIAQNIDQYIERFGDRISEELKLETITYRQNPALLIQRIQALLNQPQAERAEDEICIRRAAELKVKEGIKNPLQRLLFFNVLRRTRALVSGRENMRFERTRVFALVRSYFLALGKLWEKEDVLINAKDIFYLSLQDIENYINGTASIPELKPLVARQQLNYENYQAQTSPSARCISYGAVNQFFPQASHIPLRQSTEGLAGIGCSQGRVQAPVIVVKNPNEVGALNGEILVAQFTDPGWITLFPGAKGILVERGSLLSHSAIVSRELGLPCIVQIDGMMDTLKTGDIVEMDGTTGIVNIKK